MKLGLGIAITSVRPIGGGIVPPVGVPALTTLNAAITAPQFTFTSLTSYPPELNFEPGFDETVTEGDWLRVIASTSRDLSSPLFTFDYQLSAENVAGTEPIATAPGLAAIESPAQTYFGAFIIQPTGQYSSTVIRKHGDTTAPVLTTAASSTTTTGSPISHAWSASEYVTIALSGTDAALVESEPAAGTSGVFRLLGNANSANPPKASYSFTATATDDAGLTDSEAVTLNVASVTPVAKLVIGSGSTGAGVNRSQYIDSTDGYVATVNASTGSPNLIKSADAMPAKAHFEVELLDFASNPLFAGVTDAARAVGAAVFTMPGNASAGAGLTVYMTTAFGIDVIYNGTTAAAQPNAGALAAGQFLVFDVDQATNTVVIRHKNGGTVVTVGTYVLTSQIPTDWRPFVGGTHNPGSLRFNAGSYGAFQVTPLTDHEGW